MAHYRVCLNLKELNKITVFDPEPMLSPCHQMISFLSYPAVGFPKLSLIRQSVLQHI